MSDAQDEPRAAKDPAKSRVILNTLMMPEHANHFGNVHGGVIMKLADEAAAIAAMRHAQMRAVTVAMDSMTFKQPVKIGDVVTCEARVTHVHKSSMEVSVVVHAEDPISGVQTHTNSAYLVFVGIDEAGCPQPVPGLLLVSEADRIEYERAEARRAARLARRALNEGG